MSGGTFRGSGEVGVEMVNKLGLSSMEAQMFRIGFEPIVKKIFKHFFLWDYHYTKHNKVINYVVFFKIQYRAVFEPLSIRF